MSLQLKEEFRKSGSIKLNFPTLGLYHSISKEDLTKRAEAGLLSEQIVNAFFNPAPGAAEVAETAKQRKARLKAEAEAANS